MDDPTTTGPVPDLLKNQKPDKVTEFKRAMLDGRLKSTFLPSFFVMTVNMNGKGAVDDQRMLLLKIMREFSAHVIFCQEPPGSVKVFEKEVVDALGTDVYDFVSSGKEAAVMWRKENFDGEPVDTTATSSTRIKERLDKRSDIDTSEVLRRSAMVKLQCRGEASKYPPFLAVSWHGPHSSTTREGKIGAFRGLICFLQEVCKRTDVSSVIIGGDFNLNTAKDLKDENFNGVNVAIPDYELSPRSTEKQKSNFLPSGRRRSGRPYIPYKDNFAFFTIRDHLSNNQTLLGDIRVLYVRPFQFVDANDPSSDLPKEDEQKVDCRKASNKQREVLLDHDPILGVLELLTNVKQTPEMQVHKGQEETESLPRSFEQLSIGSNPAELHPLLGNVSSYVYDVCQSDIDGRDGSNACSIISMAVAYHFLNSDIQQPSKEECSSDWSDLLISCMREGNKLYDSTNHTEPYLTAEEAAELYLDPSSSSPKMKVVDTLNPVKLKDEDVRSTLKHHLEFLTQAASDDGLRCAALFIYEDKTISFLVSPTGSIVVTDSHSHLNHNPHGAAIMFAESFTPDFVLSLKEIANMSDSTIGSFSRVILNDVN